LAKIGLNDVRAYGLDTSNVIIEMVPLMMEDNQKPVLKRIQ
jgi:hypothetical protein